VTVSKSIRRPRYATVVTVCNISAITPGSSAIYLTWLSIATGILVEKVKYKSDTGPA
jgi:hypothetical protein